MLQDLFKMMVHGADSPLKILNVAVCSSILIECGWGLAPHFCWIRSFVFHWVWALSSGRGKKRRNWNIYIYIYTMLLPFWHKPVRIQFCSFRFCIFFQKFPPLLESAEHFALPRWRRVQVTRLGLIFGQLKKGTSTLKQHFVTTHPLQGCYAMGSCCFSGKYPPSWIHASGSLHPLKVSYL